MEQVKMQNWLEALRSGNYAKGRHRLYTTQSNSYCCLGIADVVVFGATFDKCGYDDTDNDCFLATSRAEELGLLTTLSYEELEHLDSKYNVNLAAGSIREEALSAINDIGRFTFSDIADAIEEFGWDK